MKTKIPAAIVAALATGGAHALDLRGIELGAATTPAALKAALGVVCKATPINSVSIYASGYPIGCSDDLSIGGATVVEHTRRVRVDLDADWRVEKITITFGSYSFEGFEKALREKLGAPGVVLTPVMQNGYGAQFVNTQEEWTDAAGNVVEIARYINADYGMFWMQSPADVAMARAKSAANKPKL
jgi:hypothetical protein